MRRNLYTKGLSLSQAQSISNLCHQRAVDITAELNGVNNASKSFQYGEKILTQVPAKPLPANVIDLLLEKSKLHACQGFLMSNIQLKERLMNEAKHKRFFHELDVPKPPQMTQFIPEPMVDEQWGWDQLTNEEINSYIESEAYAAHIGQFIHHGGELDKLRTELPKIQSIEFIELKKDEKTPLIVEAHHTPEQLLKLHNELAAKHREYEQKVNYFKAKVKNLVTLENARIAKENGEKQASVNNDNNVLASEYQKQCSEFSGKIKQLQYEFEQARQKEVGELASLRIEVDPKFQEVIDLYLPKVITEDNSTTKTEN